MVLYHIVGRAVDSAGNLIYPHSILYTVQANIDTNPQDMYCTPPKDERDILESLEKMSVTEIPRDDVR